MDLNVVCLWVGGKYGVEYVNRLYAMVQLYLSQPYRFICLTDKPGDSRLTAGIESIPVDAKLLGWWHKVTLFRPDPYGLHGKILFLDLDIVVVDDLTPFVDYPTDSLVMITDFQNPRKHNTSVFSLLVGSQPQVWNDLPEPRDRRSYYGDQDWISESAKNPAIWPLDWCVSYRLHAVQTHIPVGAKIVVFHGRPKPHECGGWVKELWGKGIEEPLPVKEAPVPQYASADAFDLDLPTFTWRGQMRYRCPECEFDSHSTANVVRHWSDSHRPSPSVASGPVLFGPDDKPIDRQIYVPS